MTQEFEAQHYNNLGLDALLENNFEVALENFNKALKIDPTLVGVIYNRANLCSILRSSEQAEIQPEYYEAYVNRGIVYLEQKQDAHAAIADFTKAIEIDPAQVQAYFNPCECL